VIAHLTKSATCQIRVVGGLPVRVEYELRSFGAPPEALRSIVISLP
jgi:hypothetical protein